jgi:hypothetical protein
MSEFWINFFANLASDALLAVVIYFIVTQPGEKRKSELRRSRALGLLKSEAEINHRRAISYVAGLSEDNTVITAAFPMRFTRGAWNALRESGFIAGMDDPTLAYDLFRMNELGLVANKNLRRLELAHLEETGGKVSELGELARKNCEGYLSVLEVVLRKLQGVESVRIDAQDLCLEPEQRGDAA